MRGQTLIDRTIQAAVDAERERCAQIAERVYEDHGWHPHYRVAARNIADKIRSGGETENDK